MIEIITFFKIDDQFIKVDDFEGPLPKSFFDEGIPYIEGAIQLNVDGVLLIDTSMWDFLKVTPIRFTSLINLSTLCLMI
jgi:hypothetical protein